MITLSLSILQLHIVLIQYLIVFAYQSTSLQTLLPLTLYFLLQHVFINSTQPFVCLPFYHVRSGDAPQDEGPSGNSIGPNFLDFLQVPVISLFGMPLVGVEELVLFFEVVGVSSEAILIFVLSFFFEPVNLLNLRLPLFMMDVHCFDFIIQSLKILCCEFGQLAFHYYFKILWLLIQFHTRPTLHGCLQLTRTTKFLFAISGNTGARGNDDRIGVQEYFNPRRNKCPRSLRNSGGGGRRWGR